MAIDFGRFGEEAGGSRGNSESSMHAPSSIESFTYKATPPCAVASFSFVPSPLQQTREIPVEVVWW
jgi:hypothetical protein